MDLVEKLPQMEDTGLTALHQNALRLRETGTTAQRNAAVALIPALEAELAERREAKLERARAKRKASRRTTKEASPAPA